MRDQIKDQIKDVWVSDSKINPCICVNIDDSLKRVIEKKLKNDFEWEGKGEGVEGNINFQFPYDADASLWIGNLPREDWDFQDGKDETELQDLLATIIKT